MPSPLKHAASTPTFSSAPKALAAPRQIIADSTADAALNEDSELDSSDGSSRRISAIRRRNLGTLRQSIESRIAWFQILRSPIREAASYEADRSPSSSPACSSASDGFITVGRR